MAMHISVKTMANRTKERFFLPMIFSILTLLIAVVCIWAVNHDYSQSQLFQAALCGLCFSVTVTLLAEAAQKAHLRNWAAGIGFVIGTGLYLLCRCFVPDEAAVFGLILPAVLLCCLMMSADARPEESLGRLLGCLILCAAVSLLVALILILLINAVTALFVKDLMWDVSNRLLSTAIAVDALAVAPFLLFAHLPDADTPPEKYNGLRKVLAYVILPACLILLAVLLGYIAVILIRWELPVGQINPYALLALGTFTALYLLLTGEENRLAAFFKRRGAWFLLPVIIAQAVAVYIRITAYGLTESRVFGLGFTFICLISVAAALMGRRCCRACLTVSAALAFILLASPLNAGTLARWNQESRLYGALEHAEMLNADGRIIPNESASDQDRKIIWSSAQYLYAQNRDAPVNTRTADLIRQLDAAADPEKETYYGFSAKALKLFGFDNPEQSTYHLTQTANGVSTPSEVDVEGFRHAKLVNISFDKDSNGFANVDGDTVSLDRILPLADFEAMRLSESDILLDSGRTLRINYLLKYGGIDEYMLSAWLLTPLR